MADSTVDALTAASALDGTEEFYAVQVAADRKVTGTQIKTLASDSPTLVTPNLGTPTAGVLTNVTGTASGLTAGNVTTNANLTGDVTSVGNATTLTNAPVIAKVLTAYSSGAGTISATDSILSAIQKLNGNDATNANLTGVITSVGNATSIASQTGTGTKFVVDTSPVLVTPLLGTPTSGVLTNCTGLPAVGGGTGQSTYAKGDILASPGSNTLNKLGVGTDTHVLTADAASTNGVKWAAAAASGTDSYTPTFAV